MGAIYLSDKEARRVYVVEQLVEGKLTVGQAAELLGLSTRQVQRLKGGFRQHGAAALAHGNRGRKPAHALTEPLRQQILELALGAWRDTSCQHMAELLAEHAGIHVSAKTVRRILRAAGVPLRYTHKPARRRRSRDRMPQFGLLVQVDASPYKWLETRGPELHLHAAIDDATGAILGLHLALREETMAYLHVLAQVLRNHGVPRCLYSDRHTLFFSPKRDKLTIEQELAGQQVQLTQFGRALAALGIQHIAARSPQAKGRVERLWHTLQSRLVVEMRLANITTLEQANAFLPRFIARFNRRFAVEPQDPANAFGPSPPSKALRAILALHISRKASHGSTVSYANTCYRLLDARGRMVALPPMAPVDVLIGLDGALSALYAGTVYELQAVPKPQRASNVAAATPTAPRKSHKPGDDHPWRRPFKQPRRPGPGPVERILDRLTDPALQDIRDQLYSQT